VSSDSPISSFIGLSVNVRRNWTSRLNSGSDRCCSIGFSPTEEVSTPSDEESSLIRSNEFTFGRFSPSGLVASGLRLKPSAMLCRFPLRRFFCIDFLCNFEFAFPRHAELATNRYVFSLQASYSDTIE